ncbi:hypothetical protein [Bacteroides finegoldii]|uniref:hypothetical protein n=1 Tax=Bacteroides finegoldii TaxID=338188 RepID=UPI00265CA641|nr:hypothetical protein [Bacteroides finegoldii]
MIVTTDIYKILYDKLKGFPVKNIYDSWNSINKGVKSELIVIVIRDSLEPETYWEVCYPHVNICVPYLTSGKTNTVRLNELERAAKLFFIGKSGVFDSTQYHWEIDRIGIEEDVKLACSYVNVVLKFKVLNVKI